MGETPMINCGERTVQKLYRVSIRDICVNHKLPVGSRVEVYIRIVPTDTVESEDNGVAHEEEACATTGRD